MDFSGEAELVLAIITMAITNQKAPLATTDQILVTEKRAVNAC